MTDPRRLLDDGSGVSPALRALLDSARRGDDPRGPQLEALSARIAAAIAPLAPPVAPAPPPAPTPPLAPTPPAVTTAATGAGHAALVAKAGAVIAALGLVGAGVWLAQRDDARAPVATRHAIELDAGHAASAIAPVPDEAAVADVDPPPPAPPPERTSAPPRPPGAPRGPRGADDSAAETRLVVDAGAALVRGDAAAALALTRQHLARFPAGAHAEERDRIAIEALARLGGRDDARGAAERFFLRYPRSIYRSRIEGLVR